MAPLPFRPNKSPLPNNKPQAMNRTLSLDRSLRYNPTKREHVSDFMDKILQRGHAEKATEILDSKERWYLPMFGIYHPKKKDAIRMVFDSSPRFGNVSLNAIPNS